MNIKNLCLKFTTICTKIVTKWPSDKHRSEPQMVRKACTALWREQPATPLNSKHSQSIFAKSQLACWFLWWSIYGTHPVPIPVFNYSLIDFHIFGMKIVHIKYVPIQWRNIYRHIHYFRYFFSPWYVMINMYFTRESCGKGDSPSVENLTANSCLWY